MDAVECLKSRKSSRKFLSRNVPAVTIREVIQDAMRAPSYRNSQPWEVVVVTGQKKNDLSKMLNQLLESKVKSEPDIPEPPPWPEYLQSRMADTMTKRSEAFGISLKDPDAAIKSKQANFNFYGAPAGLFFYQDAFLGLWSLLDMGMFVENVMLGFHARGLATVPQAFLIDYSPQVKSMLNIPEDKKLVLGMSVGYPDLADVRSSFVSPRVDVDQVLHWVE